MFQSTDSTEALQNIFNLRRRRSSRTSTWTDDTTASSARNCASLRRGDGAFQWVGGLYYRQPAFGLRHLQPGARLRHARRPAVAGVRDGRVGRPLRAAGSTFNSTRSQAAQSERHRVQRQQSERHSSRRRSSARRPTSSPDAQAHRGPALLSIHHRQQRPPGGPRHGIGNATTARRHSARRAIAVLPKINLSYEPTPDLTLYGTLAKGSRPGGVNLPIPLHRRAAMNPYLLLRPGSGPCYVTSSRRTIAPDAIWSFEMGEKARFADRRFTVNADVFYVKWTDIQQVLVAVLRLSLQHQRRRRQVLRAGTRDGGESDRRLTLDLSGRLYPGLHQRSAADARRPPASPGTACDQHSEVHGRPGLELRTMCPQDYKWQLPGRGILVGPVQDRRLLRRDPAVVRLDRLPGGRRQGRWTASLFGTNLTNKHAAIDHRQYGLRLADRRITRVSTNQPRTIGLAFETSSDAVSAFVADRSGGESPPNFVGWSVWRSPGRRAAGQRAPFGRYAS